MIEIVLKEAHDFGGLEFPKGSLIKVKKEVYEELLKLGKVDELIKK